MHDQQPLLTISSFARLVGLTPSALRFYDDCGLLRPDQVDGASGYRYYTAAQERRGIAISRLRAIGLPLQDIRLVLDGDPDQARAVLRSYAEETAGRARRARETTDDVIASLRAAGESDREPTTATMPGPELASAIRQVSPAAAAAPDIPALQGVLFEITVDGLTVVATDRYWMAVRSLPLHEVSGPDRALVVPSASLPELASWASRRDRVRLRATDHEAALEATDARLAVPTIEAEYPSYQAVLAGLPATAARVTVDRQRLLDEIDRTGRGGGDDVLVLTTGAEHLDLRLDGDRHGVRLPAVCTGAALAAAFRPGLLAQAVSTSIGPEVLLELADDPSRPAVVRSADQGTFTTVVMPVRRERP
ncbi:MerR family transcriptional regulator [Flexivirga sp. ID2601S]|uniref:MerR family transcriptional regulator n=1 Tax=Flexivirga aerilata TaxID=1656889 RepID=A0A849AMJ9_9MICO|nr:MerR family transcriptional regulator [Flexivirga aerilata]